MARRELQNRNVNLIHDRLLDIMRLIGEHSSYQQTLLREAQSSAEAEGGITPRFLDTPREASEESDPISQCHGTIQQIHDGLCSLFDTEISIVGLYKSALEQFQINENTLKALQEQSVPSRAEPESVKVQKLTQKLQEVQREMEPLQSLLEELQSGRGSCEKCPERKQRIKELEADLTEEREQKSRLKSEIKDLKRPTGRRVDSSNEDLARENSSLRKYAGSLEEKTEHLLGELEKLAQENDDTKALLDDHEGALAQREAAIEKSQTIIKKLNDECERLALELNRCEEEISSLKKNSRHSDRNWTEAQRQINEIEQMRKTEKRLRDQIQALKMKNTEITSTKNANINDLNITLEKLVNEKSMLEGTLEELEDKLREIEKMSSERVEVFYESTQKIQELEDALEKKEEEIKRIQEEAEQREQLREEEVQHWKKQSENVIRYLHSLQQSQPLNDSTREYVRGNKRQSKTPLRPASRVEKENRVAPSEESARDQLKNLTVSPANVSNLAAQLEAALDRENALKRSLNEIIVREGENIRQGLDLFKLGIGVCRPETERWIMRNEELEQRLQEMYYKNAKLRTVVADFKKIMHFKNLQMEDQLTLLESFVQAITDAKDLADAERKSALEMTLSGHFPYAEDLVQKSLSQAHNKIHTLREEIATLRSELEETTSRLHLECKAHNSTTQDLRVTKEHLQHSQMNLQKIKEQLGISPKPIRRTVSFSELQEPHEVTDLNKSGEVYVDDAHECLQGIKELQYSDLQLSKLREEHRSIKDELDRSMFKLNELSESYYFKEREWAEATDKIHDDLQAVAFENSEKVQIQSRLEDQIEHLVNQLEDYKTLAKTIEGEKSVLEQNYDSVQTCLRNAQTQIESTNHELNHLQAVSDRKTATISQLERELDNAIQELATNKSRSIQEAVTEKERFFSKKEPEEYNKILQDAERERSSTFKEQVRQLQKENIELRGQLERAQIQAKNYNRDAKELEIMLEREREMFAKTKGEKDDRSYIQHLEGLVSQKNMQISQISQISQQEGKTSFQKRVQEFELVLRFLEEKINSALNSSSPQLSDRLCSFMEELAYKNPALDSWIRVLLAKIDSFSQQLYLQQLREIHTYTEVCKAMTEKAIGVDAFQECYLKLSHRTPDLEELSTLLLRAIVKHVKSKKHRHHTKTDSSRATSKHFPQLSKNM